MRLEDWTAAVRPVAACVVVHHWPMLLRVEDGWWIVASKPVRSSRLRFESVT